MWVFGDLDPWLTRALWDDLIKPRGQLDGAIADKKMQAFRLSQEIK
jgi:hypothetical protein